MSTTQLSQLPITAARDPAGIFPFSGAVPFQTYGELLADVLGCYSNFTTGTRPLSGAPTAGLTLNNLVSTVVTNGTRVYPFILQAGTGTTYTPIVVQPFDFNATTNAVNYVLASWHAQSYHVEGSNGLGYVGFIPQSQAPSTPTTSTLAYSSGTAFTLLSPYGSTAIPTVGNTQYNFLRGDGNWAYPAPRVTTVTTSGTLVANTYTVVKTSSGTTSVQTLPTVSTTASAFCTVKNQGTGTVAVSTGSTPMIYSSSSGSIYPLGASAATAATFTWDGTYWNT